MNKMYQKELIFAKNFFDHDMWEFHPNIIRLTPSCSYKPDFYDQKRDVFIEVVGTRQAYQQNKAKYELLKITRPEIKFEIRRHTGEIYKCDRYKCDSNAINVMSNKRLRNGVLIKLSEITKLSIQVLSDYSSVSKRPSRKRALLLEDAASKMGIKINASMWLYGSGEEIKTKLNRVKI